MHVKPPVMRCGRDTDLLSPVRIRALGMTYLGLKSQHCRPIAHKENNWKPLGKYPLFNGREHFVPLHEYV